MESTVQEAVPVQVERTDTDYIEIRPPSGFVQINWRELWTKRELLFAMMHRDITARYKQTKMGILWAVLQPVFTVLIFTIVFSRVIRVDTAPIPYPVFALSGLLVWSFFTASLTAAAGSLVGNAHLLTKVYFPRLYLPIAALASPFIGFLVSLVLLAGLMVFYQTPVGPRLLLVPLILVLVAIVSLGPGMLMASMAAFSRDVLYAQNMVIQFLMYASPVFYPSRLIDAKYHMILALNPMFGVLELNRAILLGTPIHWPPIAVSLTVAAVMFVAGLVVFRKAEATFVDYV